jgi:hypothetical protein
MICSFLYVKSQLFSRCIEYTTPDRKNQLIVTGLLKDFYRIASNVGFLLYAKDAVELFCPLIFSMADKTICILRYIPHPAE